MASTFQEIIRLISNGELVDEATINRVLSGLDSNTKYVLSLLQNANIGSAVFARNVSVDASTNVGTPVYYDSASSRFMPAIAEASTDSNGNFIASIRSQVWGIVYVKHNSTSADLLVDGYAGLDVSSVVQGSQDDGTYYLSSSSAGMITLQPQPVTVPILQKAGSKVNVRIRFYDPSSEHKHYKFPLVAHPAGDTEEPATSSDPHVITNPDGDVEGWLPAAHASFDGNAPAGAVFGYNLAASNLRHLWPPVPIASASIVWSRGQDSTVGGTEVSQGSSGFVVLDQHGIWWMTDCYGEVPWPTDLDTQAGTTTASPDCPGEDRMELLLYFTRAQATTEGTVVTSLVGDPTGVIKIECANSPGLVKSTGPLRVLLDLSLAVDQDTPDLTGFALKDLSADGIFSRGPVVSRLKSNTGRIVVSGTSSDSYFHGDTQLTFIDTPVGQTFQIEAVRLVGGAGQADYQDMVAYEFKRDRSSSIRCRYSVQPGLTGVASLGMKLRFTFLGRTNGQLPSFSIGARTVPTLPISTAAAVPTVDSSVSIDMTVSSGMTVNQIITIESAEFSVEPGDLVLFTLERNAAGGDGYNGDILLLGMSAVVSSVVAI